MGKEIYTMLTKGNDGKFMISTYETIEKANKALEMHVDAQKDIEGVGGNVYVNYHKHERLSVPDFVLKPDSVLSHVTINIQNDGNLIKTDRYIIKTSIE
jgi:hypothetical protein